MDKVNVSEPQESVEETIESTEKISASALIKKKKGRIYGYFRIALIMGIILWVTDLLILFLDGKSFAALSLVCLVYTVVMAAAFFNTN